MFKTVWNTIIPLNGCHFRFLLFIYKYLNKFLKILFYTHKYIYIHIDRDKQTENQWKRRNIKSLSGISYYMAVESVHQSQHE